MLDNSPLNLGDFDGVAFDIEGTLADTIPSHHAARLSAFAQHGFGHITPKEHAKGPTYGSTVDDIVGGILHAAGAIEHTSNYKDHPLVRKIKVTKTSEFEKLAALGFAAVPGGPDFVREIARHFPGKVAFVTSSPERFVMPFLSNNGLLELVTPELIISGDTIEALGLHDKPAADPYVVAKERLSAQHILVFEDTIPGTASGKLAGATVITIANEPSTAQLLANSDALPYPPDRIINNYDEARSLLRLAPSAQSAQ
jgi:beta-phosphoglucomutase-like phosphatase (HAD superfamily)